MRTQSDLEANTRRDPVSGCWLLKPSTAGYARIDGELAHRHAWRLASGEEPPLRESGLMVCHTCDLPNCVRNTPPGVYIVDGREVASHGHLFVASALDNQRDRRAKRRHGISRSPVNVYAVALDAYNRADPPPAPPPIYPPPRELAMLLTLREVAEQLRVSTRTVTRLIAAGTLPAITVGSRLRVREDDLQAYVLDHAVGVGVGAPPGVPPAPARSPDPGPRAGARPRPSAPADSQPARAISSPNPSHRKRA